MTLITEAKIHRHYMHDKTGNMYKIISLPKIKQDGTWTDNGVVYEKAGDSGITYFRTIDEFRSRFSEIPLGTTKYIAPEVWE
jgi:hypothetical protein